MVVVKNHSNLTSKMVTI